LTELFKKLKSGRFFLGPGMLSRPAGHEAKAEAEARKSEAEDEAEAQIFFEAEAEATMYEAEDRHVREQLSVYEHED